MPLSSTPITNREAASAASYENEMTMGAASYWTPLPNALLVKLIWTRSSAAQSVILYVLRHTTGYHETAPKAITLEEFQHGRKRRDGTRIDTGTGLSRSAVIDGLKRAVAAGLLREEVDARDRARIVKRYAIALEVRSPETTAGEQAVQRDGAPLARKRLTLIKGQGQGSPMTPSLDEPEEACTCAGSPMTPSLDERTSVLPPIQGSPMTPPEKRQRLPPWKPKATTIRERNLERETEERNTPAETDQASLGRPMGAQMQESRGAGQRAGPAQPEASLALSPSGGEKYPLVTEEAAAQVSFVEAPPDIMGSLSDQRVAPAPAVPGIAQPDLQVEPEQLDAWREDVAEQRQTVARVQAAYDQVSTEVERCLLRGHGWGELRRHQRFVQRHLEAEQQKLAQFERFVQLIEQGYSKDEAGEQVCDQAPCPTEQEEATAVDSASVSQGESSILAVTETEPTPAPELSPQAWRAALFTGVLALFGWKSQHLNKNSRGLANKAAMLLQESGIRPEQLPRLKQCFERAYPKVTHYTPIALANHATELAAAL